MKALNRREAALQYAGLGWPVFPVHGLKNHVCSCGNVACKSVAKHPITMEGFKQATNDVTTINQWWADHPYANIGIRTGRGPVGAGIVVLDVDAKHGGLESLRQLETQHGKLPDTVTVITGGGGYHYFFMHPGVEVGNRQNMFSGLDVRGDGGYVVASPSTHSSGKQYLWLPDHSPDQIKPAPIPDWLLKLMLDKSAPVAAVLPVNETGAKTKPVVQVRHYSDSPAIQNVLTSLDRVTRTASGWSALCPAHDDRNPSLSISEGDDGRVLIHCHAGCSVSEIVDALGLDMSDLFPPKDGVDYDLEYELADDLVVLPTAWRWDVWDIGVSFLEEDLGPHSYCWVYQDPEGRDIGVVIRWDTADDGKTFRPLHLASDGWMVGAMPAPRPLYRLPSLKHAGRVYVCEGEKAADAACAVGLTATTSCGGAKAAGKTDWSALAGKEVVILPDRDEAGEDYAEVVIGLLLKLEPTPTVKVVRLPDLPEHGDMADFVALLGGDVDAVRTKVEALADQAEFVTVKNAKPAGLMYQPFPVKALPMRLTKYVVRVANALGCDASYVVLPLLAALAAAIGNARAIRLKPGWIEPSVVWAAIVGDSGTLKSPALDKALRPARERQREAMRAHDQALDRYKHDMLYYERSLKEWKVSDEPAPPPAEPDAPVAERYVVEDITIEALATLLQDQPRGLLLVRDELSGWLSDFNRYASGRGGDAAKWLEMFGAKPLTVDRKTGALRLIYVPRAAVSIAGGIQPETLRRALGDEYMENGLAARLLFAMPPRKPKRWTDAGIDPSDEQDLKRVFDKLYNLRMDTDEKGDPVPLVLDLTPEARKVWIAFYNEHADEQFRLGGALASAWSKLEGYAARFALVIHMVRSLEIGHGQPGPMKIDEVSIRAGITLARWFGHEAKRVYARLKETEGDRDRREQIDRIREHGGQVTVRDWQHLHGPKTAKLAEAQLQALQDAGYGTLDAKPQRGAGRPSKQFTLHAAIFDNIDFDKMPRSEPGGGVLSEGILSNTSGADSCAEAVEQSTNNPAADANDKTLHNGEPSGFLSTNILSKDSASSSSGADDLPAEPCGS